MRRVEFGFVALLAVLALAVGAGQPRVAPAQAIHGERRKAAPAMVPAVPASGSPAVGAVRTPASADAARRTPIPAEPSGPKPLPHGITNRLGL